MSRISREAMIRAISKVRAMSRNEKEALADELFRTQPHLFGSFLVQQRLESPYRKWNSCSICSSCVFRR